MRTRAGRVEVRAVRVVVEVTGARQRARELLGQARAPARRRRTSAAAPATCGAAIDVPLIVFVAVSLVCQAEVMLDPGAKMSRHVP